VGRDARFIAYVSSLVQRTRPTRYLDLGCGQGFLLGSVSAPEKFGIDISRMAVEQARRRVDAELAQGIAEELPFPAGYFDVVTAIGVMEHFIDSRAATREISRVLREGGSYIVWLSVEAPLLEKFLTKLAEFIYPQFRPLSVLRWSLACFGRLLRKRTAKRASRDPIGQPVRNRHTVSGAMRIFEHSGFKLRSLITKRNTPDAPLQGHHFRIYVLEKATSPDGRS
jgi:ubiquinone/menaquinone biosynthesis C-methylase UbiE